MRREYCGRSVELLKGRSAAKAAVGLLDEANRLPPGMLSEHVERWDLHSWCVHGSFVEVVLVADVKEEYA
jgi:hypothetical protein